MQLKASCILNVPFQNYVKDFSFFVNGEEFKTSRIVSDILSPKICKIHQNDPTFSTFTINTHNKGHFSYILDLITFHRFDPPESEHLFIEEIVELLDNDSIELNFSTLNQELTLDNVFSLLQKYEKSTHSKFLEKIIEFMASQFTELSEKHKDDFASLDIDVLIKIISNDHFQISEEDDLLNFVNFLYKIDSKYSILYEHVNFLNTTESSISEFVEIFDMNDMNKGIWSKICLLISEETRNQKQKKSIQIPFTENNQLSGIFKYYRDQINSKIEDEINITSSTCHMINDASFQPSNVAYFDNDEAFWSDSKTPNNWICFDFKSHYVVPSHYTIKTYRISPNRHPKSWVIEGSNDGEKWTVLDKEDDCTYTKESRTIHTFEMNQKSNTKFKLIRLRSTGADWSGLNFIIIDSFELFGTLY